MDHGDGRPATRNDEGRNDRPRPPQVVVAGPPLREEERAAATGAAVPGPSARVTHGPRQTSGPFSVQ